MEWTKIQQPSTYDIQPRVSMSFFKYGNNLHLFGGSNKNCKPLDDYHVYNPQTYSWSLAEYKNEQKARKEHQTVVVSNDNSYKSEKVYILGGKDT